MNRSLKFFIKKQQTKDRFSERISIHASDYKYKDDTFNLNEEFYLNNREVDLFTKAKNFNEKKM